MRNIGNIARGFTLGELLTVVAILGVLAGILIPVAGRVRVAAHQSQCASNLRQIGIALRLYVDENQGHLPTVAHFRPEESWIFSLNPYLDNVHEVRLCPLDPRAEAMRQIDWSTSYIKNDIIFVPVYDEFGRPEGDDFGRFDALEAPSQTMIAFIEADHRGTAPTDDHTHARRWGGNWNAVIGDIAPDRFRIGSREPNRTSGNANYLFADAHVENIPASEIRRRIEAGENIAMPPGTN